MPTCGAGAKILAPYAELQLTPSSLILVQNGAYGAIHSSELIPARYHTTSAAKYCGL
jgi:hypothetical protein